MPESSSRTRRAPTAALLAAALWLASAAAGALETDQYLVWGHELEDSIEPINRRFNAEIESLLDKVNRRAGSRVQCEDLPRKLYRRMFPTLLWSRYRKFLLTDPEIDRFPGPEVGRIGYLKRSVYRHPAFPFFLPLGRTIRVDGVHVGVDKLAGHMLGFGRRYYNRYRRARRRGLNEEEATRKVIRWGLQIERLFVGGMADGVFSHADLEANYQGLRLARDLCEASPPHLRRTADGWILARPVDLRDYVGPLWDESYNNSHFSGLRWRGVRKVLVREVCPRARSPQVQAMLAGYRAQVEASLSRQVVEEYFLARGRHPQWEQSLDVLCAADGEPAPGLQVSAAAGAGYGPSAER